MFITIFLGLRNQLNYRVVSKQWLVDSIASQRVKDWNSDEYKAPASLAAY